MAPIVRLLLQVIPSLNPSASELAWGVVIVLIFVQLIRLVPWRALIPSPTRPILAR